MATINFDSFKITQNKPRSYLYADLHLDITQQQIHHPGLQNATLGKDIELDYDLSAIINSLNNLFGTVPGQRFLIPTYGLDLLQFLFMPITDKNGNMIGQTILDAINQWEPRVSVTKILINALPESNEYDIALALYIPAFKQYTGLIGKLSPNGFSPLRTTFS